MRNENLSESSKDYQTRSKRKRSRIAVTFVPSPAFCRTIIHLQLEWAASLDSLAVPMFSLQFLDIVRDDHAVIKASSRGDMNALLDLFSSQKASPLCSTKAGWTPLHFAAARGQTSACSLLIAHGAPLGATGFRGITPLHIAAHFGRIDIFKALLKAGSDPDEYHDHGMNAVLEILSNETVSDSPDLADFLNWLLHEQEQFLLDTQSRDNSERGILYHLAYPPSWTSESERDFLYHLAYPPGWTRNSNQMLTSEQMKSIEFVLHEGARADDLDVYGVSILHKACRDGRLDLVERLLAGRCNINAKDKEGYTPLHYAIKSRNFELVLTLVRHGSDIDAIVTNYDYRVSRTPLSLAAEMDQVEVVKFLSRQGAGNCDKNISDAFRVAVTFESMQTVNYFIENAADKLDFRGVIWNARNIVLIETLHRAGASLDDESDASGESDWTALTWAARYNMIPATEKLVELGADLDKTRHGSTPLGHAAKYGHREIVHILLAAGAQTELTGDQSLTPWQLATSHGFDDIAKNIAYHAGASSTNIVTNGLSADAAEHETNIAVAPLDVEWALTNAARIGDLEVVEKLLEKGCSSGTRSHYLLSALRTAIIYEQWPIVERLVRAGAELNMGQGAKESRVGIPFIGAVEYQNAAIIELMLQYGANVNISDYDGSTPLLKSLDLNDSYTNSCFKGGEVIKILVRAGANVNAVDNYGRTPLGKAATVGNLEAVVALVEAGANLNRPSSQNIDDFPSLLEESFQWVYRVPLAWAALNGRDDVVKYLLDSGAEWQSLRKEPAISYAHRLLMQSWFPGDPEISSDAVPDFDLLTPLSSNATKDDRGLPFEPDHTKVTPSPMDDQGCCESTSRPIVLKLYTSVLSMVHFLAWWARKLHNRLQTFRIKTAAFACVSLLLLARESLRYFSTLRVADISLFVLALLIGIVTASWINQSAN